MMLKEGQKVSSFKELECMNDNELLNKAMSIMSNEAKKQMRYSSGKSFGVMFDQTHNTINRVTGTTGEGGFAPFSVELIVYPPETELALFAGVDEGIINIEQVKAGLERIGDTGFGKDASTGLGRFQLGEETAINLSTLGSTFPNACYTIAPCVPEKNKYSEMYFTPFTRFGRHGDVLATSGNPFKNPVIMADEGAVLKPKNTEVFKKPYIGRAIGNISKIEPAAIAQGYSLYLPVNVEV
jgi:CRISPR-associated protein Csm4